MSFSGSELPGEVLDYEALFERLQAGHTLITGNSRLTRVLSGQYGQWRMENGASQWQSPDILSWGLWLDRLWETASLQGIAGTDRAVPGNRQTISLWENTLNDEPVHHNLLHPESLASQLRDTRSLILEWKLDFKAPAWFGGENENFDAFVKWNAGFESRCNKGGWIAPENRAGLLCRAIRQAQLSISGHIDLLGFDEFSPLQQELLSALSDNGLAVQHLTITPQNKRAVLWKCKESKDELQQMARWVRYWFEKEPQAGIAVVVPDLQSRRQDIERQLAEILTPGSNSDGEQSRPWNISMGTPLARVAMIETAFDLLKLLDDRFDIQDIGRVLRSPWFSGAAEERNSRALLEKCLREREPQQLKLAAVEFHAGEITKKDRQGNELPEEQQKPKTWNSPEFSAVLKKLKRFSAEHKGKRPPSAWAESFEHLLMGLGWPQLEQAFGDSKEHNANWQALQAWRDGLRELASLDTTSQNIERRAAIAQLKQICRDKIFQPHTAVARIQVLGLYEISGLQFDHLWVVGLHNDNWPAGAKPNPFIPGKLQTEAKLPGSSPQRELEVAKRISKRLLEAAPDCVFSYPGQVDGEDVLASPLITAEATAIEVGLPAWCGDDWRKTVNQAAGPQLDPMEMPGKLIHGTTRGGSSILKHQALCPFRAFAINRLGADGLETPADGISAMLHGSLVHKVLEFFWIETRTQSALLQLDEDELAARVRKHVNDVTRDEQGLKQRPGFREVEGDRLFRHVMDYLALEMQREPFEVTGFEKKIQPEIEGQPVRLYIDRVDTLSSGEEVIIDYKTGRVEPKKWFGDRPEDPQLPIYAISAEKTPAAVVFGLVREDGCEFKGVVRRGGLLPNLPPRLSSANRYLVEAGENMPETIENWRQALHRLMAGFLAGEATIDPKHGLKTCETSYCELQPLCRVGELVQAQKTGQRRDTQETTA